MDLDFLDCLEGKKSHLIPEEIWLCSCISGTIMMSGCGILTNGKGTRREYGQYNLDALAVKLFLYMY